MILSVTPTKLQDFLICPRKFKFKHLEKKGGSLSSAAFSFGTTMHSALQEIHSAREQPAGLPEAAKILKRFWEPSAYRDADEEEEYFDKGCRALKNYFETAVAEQTETLGTEVYMSFVIDSTKLKLRLGCRVDRLALHPDGTMEIIDYKTSRSGKVPTAESLVGNLPAFLYYVLTRLTYPQHPNIVLTYLNVLTMEKVSVKYERATVDENKQALWTCLKEIAEGAYLPHTSENCCWCDFQDVCPATGRVLDFKNL